MMNAYPSLALGQQQLVMDQRPPLVTVTPCALGDAWPTLVKHHYLHRRRTMAQLAYAALVRGVVDGYIVYALPFGSGDRDGVPAMQCLELARLWLASNVKYTASGAIMASLKRVRRDWAAQYPNLPAIEAVCSYSDEEQHTGAVYKHAGISINGEHVCLGHFRTFEEARCVRKDAEIHPGLVLAKRWSCKKCGERKEPSEVSGRWAMCQTCKERRQKMGRG